MSKLLQAVRRVVASRPWEVLAAVAAIVVGYYIRNFTSAPTLLVALVWSLAFFLVMRVVFFVSAEAQYTQFMESYTTRDIMAMAALIAIGGVVKGYWGQVRMISEAFASFYSGMFVAWMFYLWGILACYYVRKPFCGTISMVLGGVIEILVGNPFGLPVLLFNFWEGLAPDIVYGAFQYRKFNVYLAMASGLLASAFGLVYGWFYFGFSRMAIGTFFVYIATDLGAGVIAGLIAAGVIYLLDQVGVKPPAMAEVKPLSTG